MIGEFLGKRERVSDQPRYPLSQRAVESLDVIGDAPLLVDDPMLLCWNHTLIRTKAIGIESCMSPVVFWYQLPSGLVHLPDCDLRYGMQRFAGFWYLCCCSWGNIGSSSVSLVIIFSAKEHNRHSGICQPHSTALHVAHYPRIIFKHLLSSIKLEIESIKGDLGVLFFE